MRSTSLGRVCSGDFLDLRTPKAPVLPLCCHLPGRVLSYCAGELAASLWGFWENLTGREFLKPAWHTRSHWGLGERGWLAQNQLQGVCFRMMFYIWKDHLILWKKHSPGKFPSPQLKWLSSATVLPSDLQNWITVYLLQKVLIGAISAADCFSK